MLATLTLLAATALPASPTEFVRVGGSVSTVNGSRLIGEGTRQGYRGSAIALDFEVMRFPSEFAGFEIGFLWGGTAVPWGNKATTYRIEGALDGVLFASPRGSVIVGLGPGLELGDRLWWAHDGVRGNVAGLLRTRLFPARDLAIHANARLDLFATGDLASRTLRGELLFGWSLGMLGVHWTRTWVSGGAPNRTYVDDQVGVSISLGIHG